MGNALKKTLFVLPNAIGDVLCGLGVAETLAREGELTWIVNPSAAGLLRNGPFRLLHPPSKKVQRWRSYGAPVEVIRREAKQFLEELAGRGPFDRVINLHMSRASSLMAGAVAARRRYGPALSSRVESDAWSDFLLSSIVFGLIPEWPVPARYSIVAGFREEIAPTMAAPDRGTYILLNSCAGWPSKSLSPKATAAIADALAEDLPVVLLGAPHEVEYAAAVRAQMKSSLADAPLVDVASSLEWIRNAAAIVTVDTWVLHAASAMRKPTLALLGPTRVYPRSGLALAPAGEPSWNSEEQGAMPPIERDLLLRAARLLLGNAEPVDPPTGLICWQCGPGFPVPSAPLPDSGAATERALLARARAEAFRELVEKYLPALPLPAFRPLDNFHDLYEDGSAPAQRLLKQLDRYDEMFPLYETTFPGMDAGAIGFNWRRRTVEIIRGWI